MNDLWLAENPAADECAAARTVLLVDDEPLVLEAVSLVLEEQGLCVRRATSSEMALDLLHQVVPDLIISDVTMSGMDGFAFYDRVLHHPEWSRIPFIFLTARSEQANVRQGMGLGADDYVIKPFDPDDLVAVVRLRLARADRTRATIRQATSRFSNAVLCTLQHEFRTPLSIITGYLDLLEDRGELSQDEDLLALLRGFHSGTTRLCGLVEDFLLLAQLRAGAYDALLPGGSQVCPDLIVAQAAQFLVEQLADSGLSLCLRLGAPDSLVAIHEKSLFQIVRRLLDNAQKFTTREGACVVLASRTEGGLWLLDVTDEGIGISQEALPWVFESFAQVDRARMEQQGAGLGLPIVRGLAELYGGSVAARSEPGVGSTFTVRLPLANP